MKETWIAISFRIAGRRLIFDSETLSHDEAELPLMKSGL